MAYGTLKCDNIVFDNGGTDKLVTVSGLFFSTSGALTVTGTISGGNVTAPTATFTTLTGTTTTGTTATFTSGSFTSLTGVTTTVTSGVFGLGSAAAPSIAISGDPNTGIYSPGADQVAISTNGTGRLFVDASGNVGIATSNPTSILQGTLSSSSTGFAISTSLPTIVLDDSSGTTGTSFWGQLDATTYFYNKTNGPLLFGTNNTERLRITSAGLVGIGTSSPAGKLHVIGDSATAGVGNINISNAAFPTSGWAFRIPDSGATIDLSLDGAIGGTFRSVMYFARGTGNVGIGTTASNTNGGILQLSGGITFPATAVAASDPNTLDDYEEGTWTPTQGGGLTVVGTFSSAGHYTKVGRQVTVQGYVESTTTVAAAANAIICGGLPFNVMNVTGSHFVGSGSNANLSALINVWANQASTSIYAVTSMAATTSIWFTVSYFTT